MFQTNQEENQSLFNAGVAKLMRIDRLRKRSHYHRENGNYDEWYAAYEGIREEIAERMKTAEDAEADRFEQRIKNFISTNHKELLEQNLKAYGIFLARLEYKYGYSMPDKDSAMDALR